MVHTPDVNALVAVATERVLLPKNYQYAKAALAACADVDECKSWADKAAAIASYARQSDDQELSYLADRIRARAFRRMSEIIEEIQKEQETLDFNGVGTSQANDRLLPLLAYLRIRRSSSAPLGKSNAQNLRSLSSKLLRKLLPS